jgi:hypothetical protein
MKDTVEWMFTFTNGGWNTVWAASKEEAIKLANKKYEDLKPIAKTFVEVEKNKEAYKMALNAFY